MSAVLAIFVIMIGIAAILFSIMLAIAIKLVLLGFFCWVIYRAFFRKPKVEYVAVSIHNNRRPRASRGINPLDLPLILIVLILCFYHVRRNDEKPDSNGVVKNQLARVEGFSSDFQGSLDKIKKQLTEMVELSEKPENQNQISDSSKTENVSIQSEPCATEEKAKSEIALKIREIIENEMNIKSRLSKQSIDELILNLKLPVQVETNYKEVAGEKYPFYVAKLNFQNDPAFRKKLIRVANGAIAQQRFEILLGGSAVIVAGLTLLRAGLVQKVIKPKVV